MKQRIITSLATALALSLLLPLGASTAVTPDKSKIGITQSEDIALIKMNFTSMPGAPAKGVAEIQNVGKKKKSASFEITIFAKDNKSPLFKLSGKVKNLAPGKRAFVNFDTKKDALPTDRKFIFSFRTFNQ